VEKVCFGSGVKERRGDRHVQPCACQCLIKNYLLTYLVTAVTMMKTVVWHESKVKGNIDLYSASSRMPLTLFQSEKTLTFDCLTLSVIIW